MIEFKSEINIKQAWKKIKHYYYYYDWKKGSFLPKEKIKDINVFQFFEVQEFFGNEEKRLDFLIQKIQNDTFEPERGSKYYIPKSNRGIRPFVVLNAEDLIFYQCFINVLVELFKKEFELFSDNTVFSNLPASFDSNKITYYWLDQLKKFNKVVDKKLEKDKIVVHSDITSFYTEISHPLLRTLLLNKSKYVIPDFEYYIDTLLDCMSIWTNPENLKSSKGIPQGLPQSHILANIFLFPLDQELIGKIEYIRWVDDFRIFGGTKNQTSSSIIELDQTLRRYDLLMKESKTFTVDKKLIDPFKSLEDKINSLLPEKNIKEKISLGDGYFSVVVEDSYFTVSYENYDNFGPCEEDDELREKELPEEEETNLISASKLFYLLKKIDSQKLFTVCIEDIWESLSYIFVKEEIIKHFIKNDLSYKFSDLVHPFNNFKSFKTLESSDILTDRFLRKLRFLYRTILTLIQRCDNISFYIVLQICRNNPIEIGNYNSFFQMALNSKDVSNDLKHFFQDWLISLVEPNQPIEYLKFYALEILDSDVEGYRRQEIDDYVMNYIKKPDVSWYLKYRCYKSYLSWPAEKGEAIQFCLSHYDNINNSNALKLSLAQTILNYRRDLDRTKYARSSKKHEIQNLFEKMICEENSSLVLFAANLLANYDFILLNTHTKTSKIFRQFNNEIDYKCSVRKDLEILFQTSFPSKFSFREKIVKDNQLQPAYELIQKLIHLSKRSLKEKKYESFINSVTGLIESILFTLYSFTKIKDEKRKINGFSFHKIILNKLYPGKKYSWENWINEIASIRNKNLLSHIRDIKTAEFNPSVNEKILGQFIKISSTLIQNIVDCFEHIPDNKIIETVNNFLKEEKTDTTSKSNKKN